MKQLILLLACAAALVGCSTVDPATGQRVHDPVKTEKVRAALKPLASAAVAGVVANNPEAGAYFDQAAAAVCQMRDAQAFTLENFRARLLGIIDRQTGVDPLVRIGFVSLISIFEINYAERLRADLPPDKFTWNLLDVLCDGIRGGIGTPVSP